MPRTVIALFNHAAEAREAESLLQRAGFTNDMVDVSSSPSITTGTGTEQEGTIRRFFRELFGQEPEAGRDTASAATDSVVTVHAETPDDAVRASQILDDAGAIDIDEQPSVGMAPSAGASSETLEVIEEDLRLREEGEEVSLGKEELPTPGGRVGERARSD